MDTTDLVRQNRCYETFDIFLATRPEIDPQWRPFMAPVFEEAEDDMMAFLLEMS